MAKRVNEPEEAIGPAVNGIDYVLSSITENEKLGERQEEPTEETSAPEPENELIEDPVILICGLDYTAEELSPLALSCGFNVEFAVKSESEGEFSLTEADKIHIVPDFENFVEICGVARNYFVCVFVDDPFDCELILSQCLASDAYYLGAKAEGAEREEIFAALREDGAPDAELAAICCPMGLGIGANGPNQKAVAIMAEILAARAGVLKRFR